MPARTNKRSTLPAPPSPACCALPQGAKPAARDWRLFVFVFARSARRRCSVLTTAPPLSSSAATWEHPACDPIEDRPLCRLACQYSEYWLHLASRYRRFWLATHARFIVLGALVVYPARRQPGRKFVSQCNKGPRCKAAIQEGARVTSAAYNLVLEWVPQRPASCPQARGKRAVEETTINP